MQQHRGLPKRCKLKGDKKIETLFQIGEAFFVHPYSVKYLLLPTTVPGIRIAVSAPKKRFKTAIQRNTLKRQTREAVRLQQNLIFPTLAVQQVELQIMFIYAAANAEPYTTVEKAIQRIFYKIAKQNGDTA